MEEAEVVRMAVLVCAGLVFVIVRVGVAVADNRSSVSSGRKSCGESIQKGRLAEARSAFLGDTSLQNKTRKA